MHLVHDPARAAALALVAITAVAVISLAGCGETESTGASDTAKDSLGPVYLADCTDWNQATDEARLRTIRQIRQFAGGPVLSGGHGATLENQAAVQLFENTCANEYARGFKLYKLYTRGASLGGP